MFRAHLFPDKSELCCCACLNIRRSGIRAKCLRKQEHMTGNARDKKCTHIWQTEAWRAAKGCASNGLTSKDPGVCCFTNKKISEWKCIRTANLIALNPPRTAVLFQHQPRGWWVPGDWALSFTAVPWRKIKDTVFQFQEDCQWTSLSFQKPTRLAGPASLFHSHYLRKKKKKEDRNSVINGCLCSKFWKTGYILFDNSYFFKLLVCYLTNAKKL